ncbi:MAG: SMP-30/gluconolactonase/LRE family protein [Woeseia sp.]
MSGTTSGVGGTIALVAIVLIALPSASPAQSGVAESQQHLRDANKAYEAEDFPAMIRSLETARELNPASLYTRYNLAAAYARNGDTERALELLEALVRARVDYGIADDSDFASLAGLPRFKTLLQRLVENTTPSGNSRIHYDIQRIDLLPEGIAWDAASERLFFGSMRTGEVFVLDAEQQLTKFAELLHPTPQAAIGMTVDSKRDLLWVIGSAFFLTENARPDAPRWSGVFGFDLKSGEEKFRYLRDDVGFGFNDVTVAPNGDLYLSGNVIGRVPANGTAIEKLETSQPIFGSNGIVVTPDGNHLITSSYPATLAVVRLADGRTNFLTAPADIEQYGIDGLYLHAGDLIAVQQGIKPWRLMRFTLNDTLTAITAARTLDFANPLVIATTGAIVGDEILLIGQGAPVGEMPAHIPEAMREFVGRSLIMTAPLD